MCKEKAARGEPLLRVEHLTKEFPVESGVISSRRRGARKVHAVEDVSFEIYPGETNYQIGRASCRERV